MQDTRGIGFGQKIGRVPCDYGQKHMGREMIIKKILDRCSDNSVSREGSYVPDPIRTQSCVCRGPVGVRGTGDNPSIGLVLAVAADLALPDALHLALF